MTVKDDDELELLAAMIGGGKWEFGQDGILWNENENEVVKLQTWGRTPEEEILMGTYLEKLHNALPRFLIVMRAAELLAERLECNENRNLSDSTRGALDMYHAAVKL